MKFRRFQLGILMAGCVFMLSGCFMGEEEKNLKEGKKLIEEQNYEEAVLYLQNAMSEEDAEYNSMVYTALGTAWYHMGEYENAIEAFDTALLQTEEKKAYDLYCFRGDCEYRLGQYEAAATDFANALQIKDSDLKIYIQQYHAWNKAGNEQAGIAALEQAVIHVEETDEAEFFYDMGKVRFWLEDYATANQLLQKAVEKEADSGYYYLGEIARIQENMEDAKEYYNLYLSECEEREYEAAAYNQLAYLNIESEEYEAALDLVEKGLKSEPANQALRKNKVYVLEQLLRFEEAKEAAESYLTDYPEDEEMNREYVFIQSRVSE